jgi:hypothetical protein
MADSDQRRESKRWFVALAIAFVLIGGAVVCIVLWNAHLRAQQEELHRRIHDVLKDVLIKK